MSEKELTLENFRPRPKIRNAEAVKALRRYKGKRWKTEAGVDGKGEMHYCILRYNRETGFLHIAAIICNAQVDRPHRHKGVERIITGAGKLDLMMRRPHGLPYYHEPGDSIVELPDGSVHWPSAEFWWGEYTVENGIEFLGPEEWMSR